MVQNLSIIFLTHVSGNLNNGKDSLKFSLTSNVTKSLKHEGINCLRGTSLLASLTAEDLFEQGMCVLKPQSVPPKGVTSENKYKLEIGS